MSIMRIFSSQSSTKVDGFQLTRFDAFRYVFNEKGLFSGIFAFFVGRKVTRAEVEIHIGNETKSIPRIYSKLIELLVDRKIESYNPNSQKENNIERQGNDREASQADTHAAITGNIRNSEDLQRHKLNVKDENALLKNQDEETEAEVQTTKETEVKAKEAEAQATKEAEVKAAEAVAKDKTEITPDKKMNENKQECGFDTDRDNLKRDKDLLQGFLLLNDNEWTEANEELRVSKVSIYSNETNDFQRFSSDTSSDANKERECYIVLGSMLHSLHDEIKSLVEVTINKKINENEIIIQKESSGQAPSQIQTPVLMRGDICSSMRNNISDYEKEVQTIKDTVKKRFLRHDKLKSVEKYIDNASLLLFEMLAKEPPIYLDFNAESEDLQSSTMKPFMVGGGDKIDFRVWPSVFFHEGGKLVSKGIVEVKRKNKPEETAASGNNAERMSDKETLKDPAYVIERKKKELNKEGSPDEQYDLEKRGDAVSKMLANNEGKGGSNLTDLNDPNRDLNVMESLLALYSREWTEACSDLFESKASVFSTEAGKWCGFSKDDNDQARECYIVFKDDNDHARKCYIVLGDIFHALHDGIKEQVELEIGKKLKENKSKIAKEKENEKLHKKENRGKDMISQTQTPVLSRSDVCLAMRQNISNYRDGIQRIQASAKDKFIECPNKMGKLEAYIDKSSALLFNMLAKGSPIRFEFNEGKEDVDLNEMNMFTTGGKKIDYRVWPTTFLENGTVLSRGIVQGKSK